MCAGTAEHQGSVVEHEPRAQRAAIADLQRAAADRRRAHIAVAGREGQHAATHLREAARAADDGTERHVVGVVQHDRRVVAQRHAAGRADRRARAASADLQGPAADRRRAGVGIAGRENHICAAHLREAAAAADDAAERGIGGKVESQRAVVRQRARAQRACDAAIAELQRARGDRRRAHVGVATG